MKRLLSILLVICMIIPLCLHAEADTYTYSTSANSGTRDKTCTTLDGTRVNSYYTGSYSYENLTELSSSNLLGTLRTLMTSTHKKNSSYDDCHYMANKTDCENGDGTSINLIYSSYSATQSDWNNGWNREHVWPKSLGGYETSGAGADLHHIRPSDARINSTRGNKKYGNVNGGTAVYGNSYSNGAVGGAYSGNYFEPLDNAKGDVARICLYMYVRYGGDSRYTCSSISTIFQSVDVLLEWCALDPVDTWEMGRNEVVAAYQGNRNVFIDYPELAWQLFGKDAPEDLVTPSGNTGSSGGTGTTPKPTTPVVTEPVETDPPVTPPDLDELGTGYKIFVNANSGKLWVKGTVSSGRFDGTFNESEAAIVYMEASGEGYRLFMVNGSQKTYINMADESTGASLSNSASGATVYIWNAELNTMVVADPDNARAFGHDASKTYTNFSCYATSNGNTYLWGQFVPVDTAPDEPECKHTNTKVEGAVAATCAAPGKTGKTVCTDCGEVIKESTDIARLSHTPGAAATCTTPQKCIVCQAELHGAKGHTPGAAATCTDPQRCSVCQTILKEATGHKPGPAATCSTPQKCTVCQIVLQGTVDHKPGAAATCTEPQKCTVCHGIVTPSLGHTFANGVCTHPGCGVLDPHCTHAHTKVEGAVAATCTTAGRTGNTLCTDCGSLVSESTEIAPIPHTPGAPATCTTPQKCTICHTIVSPILVHQFGEPATCTTPQLCANCQCVLVPALGHTAGAAATCTEAQKCTVCQATLVPALGHMFTNGTCTRKGCNAVDSKCKHTHTKVDGAVAPTCTNPGKTGNTLCTDCGALVTASTDIKALGHKPGPAATCTEAQKCTVCKAQLAAAKGHDFVNGKCKVCNATNCTHSKTELRDVKAATCGEHGYTGDTYCSTCGHLVSKGSAIDATNQHEMGEWVIVEEPTASTAGQRERECTVCGHRESETIPATGTTNTEPTVPATTPEEPDPTEDTKPSATTPEPTVTPTQPSDDQPDENGGFPWIIIVLVAVAVVCVVIVIPKGKKDKA